MTQIDVSKLNVYAVMHHGENVKVTMSKLRAYALLAPDPIIPQAPVTIIVTV
jgi:hypothetical protein